MRRFMTLSGNIINLTMVSDLDENTVIGFEQKTGNTKIFDKSFEVCPKCEMLGNGDTCDEHSK